jgi:hypothetical protein
MTPHEMTVECIDQELKENQNWLEKFKAAQQEDRRRMEVRTTELRDEKQRRWQEAQEKRRQQEEEKGQKEQLEQAVRRPISWDIQSP